MQKGWVITSYFQRAPSVEEISDVSLNWYSGTRENVWMDTQLSVIRAYVYKDWGNRSQSPRYSISSPCMQAQDILHVGAVWAVGRMRAAGTLLQSHPQLWEISPSCASRGTETPSSLLWDSNNPAIHTLCTRKWKENRRLHFTFYIYI